MESFKTELSKQLRNEVNSDKVLQYIVDRDLMDPTLWDAQSFSFLGKMVSTDSDCYQKLSAMTRGILPLN